MQIVIYIPDEDVPNKQEVMEIDLHFINGEVCECSYPYIILPKGHGRLIDADDLNKCVVDRVTMPYVPISKIQNAPTIIEADKEGYAE